MSSHKTSYVQKANAANRKLDSSAESRNLVLTPKLKG
jgi:hypothetical protein